MIILWSLHILIFALETPDSGSGSWSVWFDCCGHRFVCTTLIQLPDLHHVYLTETFSLAQFSAFYIGTRFGCDCLGTRILFRREGIAIKYLRSVDFIEAGFSLPWQRHRPRSAWLSMYQMVCWGCPHDSWTSCQSCMTSHSWCYSNSFGHIHRGLVETAHARILDEVIIIITGTTMVSLSLSLLSKLTNFLSVISQICAKTMSRGWFFSDFTRVKDIGPYQLGNTSSCTVTEVKHFSAWLIFGWETVPNNLWLLLLTLKVSKI